MPLITLRSVYFHYDSTFKEIFTGLDLAIDTSWKTGIVGRNGCGKTTLLRLISGSLEPVNGSINVPVKTAYFPYSLPDESLFVFSVIKNSIAPYSAWEKEMNSLLENGDGASIERYNEVLDIYSESGGYEIDGLIEKEGRKMGLDRDFMERDFSNLNSGEKTRCMIVALFLKSNSLPLLDEPANHLDMKGREKLGEYLAKQKGFILVSHDRYFLDICLDHTIAIEKAGVSICKGNYSRWKENRDRIEAYEIRRNKNIKSELVHLKESAEKRRNWSHASEKEKTGKAGHSGSIDKGYLSAVSSRIMKRAVVMENRMDRMIGEKKKLLKNLEKKRHLKLDRIESCPDLLLLADHISAGYGEKPVIRDISLTIRQNDRLAVIGGNGSGKTTLLKSMMGKIPVLSGNVYIPGHIKLEILSQNPEWTDSYLADRLEMEGIDPVKFRNIAASMGISGDISGKKIDDFSDGERKKIELLPFFLKAFPPAIMG